MRELSFKRDFFWEDLFREDFPPSRRFPFKKTPLPEDPLPEDPLSEGLFWEDHNRGQLKSIHWVNSFAQGSCFHKLTADVSSGTLQTQTLQGLQGTPCKSILTGKTCFHYREPLFWLQGPCFLCKSLYFPVRDCSVAWKGLVRRILFS